MVEACGEKVWVGLVGGYQGVIFLVRPNSMYYFPSGHIIFFTCSSDRQSRFPRQERARRPKVANKITHLLRRILTTSSRRRLSTPRADTLSNLRQSLGLRASDSDSGFCSQALSATDDLNGDFADKTFSSVLRSAMASQLPHDFSI